MAENLATHEPRSICLDFDDTVCSQEAEPIDGARDAIAAMRSWGYRVLVSSARFSPLYGDLNAFRMQRVRSWFSDRDIAIDDVCYHVPPAALSIDDLGWRFPGTWPELLGELAAAWPHGLQGRRISVALDCVLAPDREAAICTATQRSDRTRGSDAGLDERHLPEAARNGLDQLLATGAKVVISSGPWLGKRAPETLQRGVRRHLESAGLRDVRVETAKVSSDAYVSPNAYRFRGDWDSAIREIESLLLSA